MVSVRHPFSRPWASLLHLQVPRGDGKEVLGRTGVQTPHASLDQRNSVA